MNLKLCVAAVALTAISAPATAAPIFDFNKDHPFTLAARGSTFVYDYFAQSVGVDRNIGTAADALFYVEIKYYNTDENFYQVEGPDGGKATAGDPNHVFGLAYMLPPYEKILDYYFTFKTLSDQTIRISDIAAKSLSSIEPNPEFTAISAPLPEPATWAMMLLGFGLTGVGLRRSRQKINVRLGYRLIN